MTRHPPTPIPFDDWPRPLAFALSGGGAYGSVQVGMIKALLERGVVPDLIVGSSVGALNGALLAARPDSAVEELTELWRSMNRRVVFGGRSGAGVPVIRLAGIGLAGIGLGMARNLMRDGALCRPDRLGALIERRLGSLSFEDLPIRFAAVVTDAQSGQPDLLCRGPVQGALIASTAIPGVFPRVTLDGRVFVDGGVAANVPIRQAITFGANSVLSLDASPATPPTAIPGRLVGGLLHSVNLMIRNQRAHAVEDLAPRHRIALLPNVTPPDISSFDFGHTEELLDRSYRETVSFLDAWLLGREQEPQPERAVDHHHHPHHELAAPGFLRFEALQGPIVSNIRTATEPTGVDSVANPDIGTRRRT